MTFQIVEISNIVPVHTQNSLHINPIGILVPALSERK